MIQFNLLPDVKLEYVKTQRTKRFLTLLSFAVSTVSIAALIISVITVDVVQKKSLHDEGNDITRYGAQLRNTPDLNKILTVQNQLKTLATLHDQKPVSSRLFTYITQITPAMAALNQLNIDFASNTITVGGSAPSLDVVSSYTDTLKAATYTIAGSGGSSKNAFSNVVLSSFGRDNTGATFTITYDFDPAIFNTDNNVTLSVPTALRADQSNVFQEGS